MIAMLHLLCFNDPEPVRVEHSPSIVGCAGKGLKIGKRRIGAALVQSGQPMRELLDNILWHSLSGSHARYSVGTRAARRYAPGFSPIAAFADAGNPDFDALAPFCEPGEHIY